MYANEVSATLDRHFTSIACSLGSGNQSMKLTLTPRHLHDIEPENIETKLTDFCCCCCCVVVLRPQ